MPVLLFFVDFIQVKLFCFVVLFLSHRSIEHLRLLDVGNRSVLFIHIFELVFSGPAEGVKKRFGSGQTSLEVLLHLQVLLQVLHLAPHTLSGIFAAHAFSFGAAVVVKFYGAIIRSLG